MPYLRCELATYGRFGHGDAVAEFVEDGDERHRQPAAGLVEGDMSRRP